MLICIKITIRINAKPRGPSYWKLDIDVLKENEYVAAIGNIFGETVNNYQNIICKRMVWDLFKIKVKEYTILYCKKKHKKQNVMFEYENKLKEIDLKLANLKFNENIDLQMEREQVKTKLDEISMERARGFYIRSRAQWLEEWEKNTHYFLSLENKT